MSKQKQSCIVTISPLAWAVCRTADVNLKLKCVARTMYGSYIISNAQLRLAGIPDIEPMPPRDARGKKYPNHTAILAKFIQE